VGKLISSRAAMSRARNKSASIDDPFRNAGTASAVGWKTALADYATVLIFCSLVKPRSHFALRCADGHSGAPEGSGNSRSWPKPSARPA
jgi:hypothetical protein